MNTRSLSITTAFICTLLGGCATVAPITDVTTYETPIDLGKAFWKSEETTPMSVSVESMGIQLNTHSFENKVIKQWWASLCPSEFSSNPGISRAKSKFSQYCSHNGGIYNSDSGFCWKDKEVVFYAGVVDGSVSAGRCGRGSAMRLHVITPAGSQQDFTNWFKGLSTHVSSTGGNLNVYDGEYVTDRYYSASMKPLILFEENDISKLNPERVANAKAMEQAQYQQQIQARLQQEQAKARAKASQDAASRSVMQKWRSYGVGTKVCKEGTPIMGNRVQVTGFIEGFSETKLQIRIVHIGGLYWTAGGFKEHITWDYPFGWNICE